MKAKKQEFDTTSQIIAYEQGELSADETIALFQHLVSSGLAWQLQGHYGRTAAAMLESGAITLLCECGSPDAKWHRGLQMNVCEKCLDREGKRRAIFDRNEDERNDD